MIKVRCLCIDDTKRPQEITPSKWIIKDKEYTITHIFWHVQQGIQGVELAEVQLTDESFPYISYSIKRFGIHKEDLEKFEELLKQCTELSDIDVTTLIEELNLEVV